MNITERLLELTLPFAEFIDINLDEVRKMEEVIKKIQKAWSGSWIGYQANVYYEGFKIPSKVDSMCNLITAETCKKEILKKR